MNSPAVAAIVEPLAALPRATDPTPLAVIAPVPVTAPIATAPLAELVIAPPSVVPPQAIPPVAAVVQVIEALLAPVFLADPPANEPNPCDRITEEPAPKVSTLPSATDPHPLPFPPVPAISALYPPEESSAKSSS